jgi:hypothetical protein
LPEDHEDPPSFEYQINPAASANRNRPSDPFNPAEVSAIGAAAPTGNVPAFQDAPASVVYLTAVELRAT